MFSRACFLFSVGLHLATAALHAGFPADARFIMSHFKADGGGGDERLWISTSPDGLTWTSLTGQDPAWQPPNWAGWTNVVRDPSIIYDNGWYWIAFTSGNYGNHDSFGLVKTQDFVNWTYLGEIHIPVVTATTQLTWNPCFFRDGDGSVHLFISCSPDLGPTYQPVPNLKSYVTEPATADWTQWKTPVPLNLPSPNTNEFFCWKEGSIYHGTYVDFAYGAGGWQHVTSTSLTGTWTVATYLGGNAWEGGNMLKKPEGGYRFFCEQNNGYYHTELYDDFRAYSVGSVTSDVLMKNGKLIAVPGVTTFTAWAANQSPAAPNPQDDPDHDGTPNLMECALGMNPNQPSMVGLPITDVVTDNGNKFLRFRYYRWRQYAGLDTTLQSSADLSIWNTVAPLSITLMTDGSELVEGRIPLSGPMQFLRVQATQN